MTCCPKYNQLLFLKKAHCLSHSTDWSLTFACNTFYAWFAADVRLKRKDEIQLLGDLMDVSQTMQLGSAA